MPADPRDQTTDARAPAASTATVDDDRPVLAVRVTADRILCATGEDGERRTRGGILIPATAASKDRHGVWAEVREVGPLVRSTAVGDRVLFLPEAAIEVDIHGEGYVIIRERDVHAIASAEREAGSTGLYL